MKVGSLRTTLRPCRGGRWSLLLGDEQNGVLYRITKRSNPFRTRKSPIIEAAFRPQRQPVPGLTSEMSPVPDHGEKSYQGAGRLQGRKAVYGLAIVANWAGGGAGLRKGGCGLYHLLLDEEEDAKETQRLVIEGRPQGAVLISRRNPHAASSVFARS